MSPTAGATAGIKIRAQKIDDLVLVLYGRDDAKPAERSLGA